MATILIVEDHKDFRQAVRSYLEDSHIDVKLLEAVSGEEGVLLAKRYKPDIVLLDFELGGINGAEAAIQIKSILPECSIIMLTMLDTKSIESLVSRQVIKEFINKSDLFEDLIPVIKKILISILKLQPQGGA